MGPWLDHLAATREALAREDLLRELAPGSGLDLVTNDYLGLARDAGFRAAAAAAVTAAVAAGEPLTAPASRLLAGHTEHHRRVEDRLAAFKGTEAALLFPSGYQANVGLLTALLGPDDRAISDELNHAILIDGLRLSRCHKVIVPHGATAAVEDELRRPWPGRTVLVTESLFSMDGDVAPLDAWADLADRHGAGLIVDDAHATGLFGEERGSGLVERFGIAERVLAVTSTGGKALGVAGAWVGGPRAVVEHLVQRCRAFVFSTAVPPLLLLALEVALDAVAAEPERRRRVLASAARLRHRLTALGLHVVAGEGPIVPVILGGNERALEVARRLRSQGFDVRAVRPPTVPEGTSRLRLSVHADHRWEDLERLATALAAAATATAEVAAGAPG